MVGAVHALETVHVAVPCTLSVWCMPSTRCMQLYIDVPSLWCVLSKLYQMCTGMNTHSTGLFTILLHQEELVDIGREEYSMGASLQA